jgi:hypothetical protein
MCCGIGRLLISVKEHKGVKKGKKISGHCAIKVSKVTTELPKRLDPSLEPVFFKVFFDV